MAMLQGEMLEITAWSSIFFREKIKSHHINLLEVWSTTMTTSCCCCCSTGLHKSPWGRGS